MANMRFRGEFFKVEEDTGWVYLLRHDGDEYYHGREPTWNSTHEKLRVIPVEELEKIDAIIARMVSDRRNYLSEIKDKDIRAVMTQLFAALPGDSYIAANDHARRALDCGHPGRGIAAEDVEKAEFAMNNDLVLWAELDYDSGSIVRRYAPKEVKKR